MQNTAVKAKEKYERKLAKAIAKSGGIEFEYKGQDITAVLIAEPKKIFAVDNVEILSIDAILQEVSTGKVMIHNQEFGLMSFDFDFVGSIEECINYIDELGSNEITIEELLQGATLEMKELLLKRAKQHQEEGQGNGKDFEAYLNYAKDNYASRVNAVNLLGLERGLIENLQRVRAALSNQWSAEDTRTVREVLEDE